ncbi:MAG: Holliday junction resolvase RuvX [Erysipelotrichaceae bacterium]
MRILGLDLGSKTVGVAMSDATGNFAVGVETIFFNSDDYDEALEKVEKLCLNLKAEKVVVGLPKHMNGDIGERGEISQEFAKYLAEDLKIEVILWDERLTTVSANKILISADISRKKRKKVVDKVAATFILQAYLDATLKER